MTFFIQQSGNSNDDSNTPKPAPRSKFDDTGIGGGAGAEGGASDVNLGFSLPDLPNVPSATAKSNDPSPNNDDIDFDDLNKRFQELKKK